MAVFEATVVLLQYRHEGEDGNVPKLPSLLSKLMVAMHNVESGHEKILASYKANVFEMPDKEVMPGADTQLFNTEPDDDDEELFSDCDHDQDQDQDQKVTGKEASI